MYKYMLKHQKMVMEKLNSTNSIEELEKLLIFHNRQIEWMQHERLAHLIVTLFVSAVDIFLFYMIFSGKAFSLPLVIVFLILIILTFFYFVHYYRLENGVQKWYGISNSIQEKINSLQHK